MTYLTWALMALASMVIGGFVVGMGLGFMLGRVYEDHGPGDPPLIQRSGE